MVRSILHLGFWCVVVVGVALGVARVCEAVECDPPDSTTPYASRSGLWEWTEAPGPVLGYLHWVCDYDGLPTASETNKAQMLCPPDLASDRMRFRVQAIGDPDDEDPAKREGPLSVPSSFVLCQPFNPDLDGNCRVDATDFELFLGDFIAGRDSGLGTDFDGNGTVNATDFSYYFLPAFAGAVRLACAS